MELINRSIISKIEKYINDREIIALVGLRQVGKTTLMKYFKEKLEDSLYISFNDISLLNTFEEEIDVFIEEYIRPYKYVFIDEIQYSKKSGQLLKYIFDKEDTKLFISGSSKSEIAIHSLGYLVGRVIVFQINPLSFKEFVDYKNKELSRFLSFTSKNSTEKLNPLFNEFLRFGGYPEIIKEKNIEKKQEKLNSIVNSYLLKEIRDILLLPNVQDYERLLTYLAICDGGILNISNVSSNLGIDRRKLNEMITILEQTAVITIVQPFFKNKVKELIKSPKIYFSDLGFKNALIKNFNEVSIRPDKGEIYENFVLSEYIKLNKKLTFFRYQQRYEIDFILEENGETIGIEVKSKLKNNELTTNIKKFIDLVKPDKIYICNENIFEKNENIKFTNYFTKHN